MQVDSPCAAASAVSHSSGVQAGRDVTARGIANCRDPTRVLQALRFRRVNVMTWEGEPHG
jgi:hypothetical protein